MPSVVEQPAQISEQMTTQSSSIEAAQPVSFPHPKFNQHPNQDHLLTIDLHSLPLLKCLLTPLAFAVVRKLAATAAAADAKNLAARFHNKHLHRYLIILNISEASSNNDKDKTSRWNGDW